jgi:hypothetical protein
VIYVVSPRIGREAIRALKISSEVEGEQADYACSRYSVEVPFGKAYLADDKKKVLTQAKPGDVLVIEPKVSIEIQNRFVHVEVADQLYSHGRPTFKRLYKHGDKAFTPITWECLTALDLKKLPFLFEIYIVDEHVR